MFSERIKKITSAVFALLLLSFPAFQIKAQSGGQKRNGVEIVKNEAEKRVDVLIDGEPFTAYIWGESLKKPILFPIRSARGTIITRGFPLEPRAGESVDHPHQAGSWLNYGDVNGVDFWNNSIYRTDEEAKRMGTIAHRRIITAESGKKSGRLKVEADWLMPDGKTILREKTEFVFSGKKDRRSVDRTTTLTALDQKVVFADSKEGFFGLRVRRELEQPAAKPILLTGDDGKPSEKPVLDNRHVTGEFHSSERKTGDDVWGTRAKWAALSGRVENEFITIAIFDDPANIGFPTYWMARGYGLFAANPLGRKAFSTERKESPVTELNFSLEPNRSVTFNYRLLIFSEKLTPEQIEKLTGKSEKVKREISGFLSFLFWWKYLPEQ
ncbi:MAG: PmoA family protein [Pyrinomonadaceae bacterium]